MKQTNMSPSSPEPIVAPRDYGKLEKQKMSILMKTRKLLSLALCAVLGVSDIFIGFTSPIERVKRRAS